MRLYNKNSATGGSVHYVGGVTVPEPKTIEFILSQHMVVGSYEVRWGIVTLNEGARCFALAYRHRNAQPDVPWQTPTSHSFLSSVRAKVDIPIEVKFPSDPSQLPSLLRLGL